MNKINKINVCCQKVLPLVYDESLSYYEVLCKVIQKLNELIKINNSIRDEIHKEYVEILEAAKTVTETVASVTAMRDEVLTLKQATEQYANDVVTAYNETVQARDTAIAKAESAEQSAITATEKANIAEQSATTATQKASIASHSATTATQSATSAEQNANSASQSATTATEKANEAKQYADEAKASAGLVGQDVTQLKQDVRNLQTSVNENTYDISSLNTSVNENTSDISSLNTKADNNTSQITSLHSIIVAYWKTLYPIGSIYISTSPTFDPQTAWGGRWKKTADGRCLIGANDTYPIGSIGGEAEHTLTDSEMPLHRHGAGRYTGYELANAGIKGADSSSQPVYQALIANTNSVEYSNKLETNTAGLGVAHNNMQPYLAVYIWERTA